ncbi:hypothetical protein DICPUDRAFT_85336 [Dictyostelium purpureum]|uniref:Uncharacterized protein n=1 Tax=Dictyostelium purpureum TaxID=5786 RepID=F1A5E8_DICPU|nr:uncharacterized protein DICPUDRAFT_85336 [Dictyostelium purpureum]EGC28585.1 hypothetical protein DICPUDRAFT_85336 [Dictyostelium purpureum]|eukprot:XP_003294892.1 hypothetical protein DICPUDRAFT_85336 [Dictyostelium purpureum]
MDRLENLFFSVWRNCFLNKEIFRHLQLYRLNKRASVSSIDELMNHKYRDYISILCYNSSQILDRVGMIPFSVTSLYLNSYNEDIIPGVSIPSSVTKLSMHCRTEIIGPFQIPSSVTELSLHSYNHPLVNNVIPNSVRKLYLGAYNHPLHPNNIPSSVTDLEMFSFNQPILPNVLPNSLLRIKLWAFSKPLKEGSIPNTVIEFDSVGPMYEQPLWLKLFLGSIHRCIKTFGYLKSIYNYLKS